MRNCFAAMALVLAACNGANANHPEASSPGCTLVSDGFGPAGTVPVRAEPVVTGLEVPWGIAFISSEEWLVTERPGRVRLVRAGQLVADPVATLPIADSAEGGLLGIALHPDFAGTRFMYLYVTAAGAGGTTNRVERWEVSQDHATAVRRDIVIDGIPGATFHDGGRIRFGPDGMLYVGTGDARQPDAAQDTASLSGKLLRLTPDGDIPADNPIRGTPAYLIGIRNTEGFDWMDDGTLVVVDHGPSGELGRTGHDEVNMAKAGANLGWPTIFGCEAQSGMVTPSLTWRDAVPPGGAAIYKGKRIADWAGSLIVGTLGSRHLHRVRFDGSRVALHETYFQDDLGRLREVVMGPDGELYVTTSNCDGRGDCPPEMDAILRVVP